MWKTTPESFWARVDKSGKCWLWTGCKDQCGYGCLRYHGRRWQAHRLAWYFRFGKIPKGMCILHKCDVPACCNPDHLFLGTQTDNIADRVAKGRTATGKRNGSHTKPESRPRGEKHGRSKLTETQVCEIRRRYKVSGISVHQLAAEFNMSHSMIHYIVTNKYWKHVKCP